MCFSASASFTAGGGLIALGGASFAVAKKEDKILAAVPLLFGIQQVIEGVEWLYLNAGSASFIAGYGFLFFAFIVWPIYVSTTVFVLDKKERKSLKWFICLGIAVALYFFWLLLTQHIAIQKLNACVSYSFHSPLGNSMTVAYLLVVLVPLFISNLDILRQVGILVGIFAIVSWLFFTLTFTSVWCFFAAIISSIFFVYVKRKNRDSHQKTYTVPKRRRSFKNERSASAAKIPGME